MTGKGVLDNIMNTGLIHDITATTNIGMRGRNCQHSWTSPPNKPSHKNEENWWWEDLWPGSQSDTSL